MDDKPRNDRRLIIAAGGAVALLAGLGIAIMLKDRGGPTPSMDPTQRAGLQVQMGAPTGGAPADGSLRCFVSGQFVGMTTLEDCARRNGVATDALDVGLDPSGAVAATGGEGLALQPLPQPVAEAPPAPVAAAPVEQAPVGRTGSACWRYNGSDWRKVFDQVSLNECVQVLFNGRCERPGSASYGRWGEQTIRLVPGKVERSNDNRTFRTLVEQPAGDCRIPQVSE